MELTLETMIIRPDIIYDKKWVASIEKRENPQAKFIWVLETSILIIVHYQSYCLWTCFAAHLNHLMEFYSKKNYSWMKTSLAVGRYKFYSFHGIHVVLNIYIFHLSDVSSLNWLCVVFRSPAWLYCNLWVVCIFPPHSNR